MSAASCGTCIYFRALRALASGECRAEPPQIDAEHDGHWPVIESAEWCGHYRPNADATRALLESA